jgi:hypothetical protein
MISFFYRSIVQSFLINFYRFGDGTIVGQNGGRTIDGTIEITIAVTFKKSMQLLESIHLNMKIYARLPRFIKNGK